MPATTQPHILVVDDEKRALETLNRTLKKNYQVHCAESVQSAWDLLYEYPISVILSDQRMPDITGIDFLKQVKNKYPDIVRIIVSAYTDAQDLILGINEAGIYQFLAKPWHPRDLLLIVANAVSIFTLQQQNELLSLELNATMPPPQKPQLASAIKKKQSALKERHDFDKIIRSKDSVINELCARVQKFASYDISILISGESGTGKELFARAIHYNSHRCDKPMIIENCGALPDDLLESELFGCKKGAFTGAHSDRMGLFELANGGTIFLDEIGDTSPAFQVKLLRVLQDRVIRRLGDSEYIPVDVRVITATNKDLEAEALAGRFRKDLYFRLNGAGFHIPPLRERQQDTREIASCIVQQANALFGKNIQGISEQAMTRLTDYQWPGNVRELQNELHKAVILCEHNHIESEHLSDKLQDKA